MATVTHYIYSSYDPQQREALERETGQIQEENDPWQTDVTFGAKPRLPAPHFVPATVPYDAWESGQRPPERPAHTSDGSQTEKSVAGWYRSMTSGRASGSDIPSRDSLTTPKDPPASTPKPPQHRTEKQTQDSWFITRALRSEPPPAPTTPPPTLADILARDPPPLPSERKFVPRVWLTLGPSNKGFAMLTRSGWTEGEGLGAAIRGPDATSRQPSHRPSRERADREISCQIARGNHREEPIGAQNADVIDLTGTDASDEEAEDSEFAPDDDIPDPYHIRSHSPSATHDRSAPKVLLTPLPIVLKSDRLGIGLKAKTVGPYRASQKRVTHSQAALAAHISASEALRKKKRVLGRGKRGFARAKRKEEDDRKQMLAYLNK
jgi:hypothetical protein